jgi:hypothetical protein
VQVAVSVVALQALVVQVVVLAVESVNLPILNVQMADVVIPGTFSSLHK